MLKWTLFLLIAVLAMPLLAQVDSLNIHNNRSSADIPNADYYYNKGVEFFEAGSPGYANLYYLKALRLNSAHKYARENLELAIRMSPDNKLYPERPFLVRALFQGLDLLSVNRLAMLSLILLLLAALSLVWLMFYNPEKERALPILSFAFLGLLCLSSFGLLGIKSHRQNHNQLAVLVENSAQLHPLSESGTQTLTEIHAGLIVTVMEAGEDFSVVRLPNGQTGKLPAKAIIRVQ